MPSFLAGGHQDPALPVPQICVFDQLKPENTNEVGQRFIIVANNESDVTKLLGHASTTGITTCAFERILQGDGQTADENLNG